MNSLRFVTFSCAFGYIGILASVRGILSITLPHPSIEEARRQLGERVNMAEWAPESFADLSERLKAYFNGHQVTFLDRLDIAPATSFQRQVWAATRLIPFGETRTYNWVAQQIKRPKAIRAVGQALGKNPLPIIIPCHRVIASDGKLRGFKGGLEMKGRLLRLENSRIG